MFVEQPNLFDIFSKQLSANHETLVRILVYEIRLRNPNAVKFVPNTSAIKSILFHIKVRRFDTLMLLYSHAFVIELLKLYEEMEIFEVCAAIKTQIEDYNFHMHENLPTR